MKLKPNQNLLSELKTRIEAASAEGKTDAILAAITEYVEASSNDIVERYVSEAARASSDAEFAKSLGLRSLNSEESEFYAKFGTPAKAALTFDQEDVIPTSVVERTLDTIKKESGLLQYIRVLPASVKKWISASHSGSAAWGLITTSIGAELSATITSISMDVHRLAVYLLVPKAIVALGEAYVDRYFREILGEAMIDGLEQGVIDGNGKVAPIGFGRQIASVAGDGTHNPKVAVALASFAPEHYGPILEQLTNNGLRSVNEVLLICNPLDYFQKIFPASRAFMNGAWVETFSHPTRVIQSKNCTVGKPMIALPFAYDLGVQQVQLSVLKELKALDDVDVLLAKTYGNGRPVDDKCAVVLDITNLKAFTPSVLVANTTTAPVNTKEVA